MTTRAKPKSAPADPLVAVVPIFIEGKAFDRGADVTGVGEEELSRAINAHRVIHQSVFAALGHPAPDIDGQDKEPDA